MTAGTGSRSADSSWDNALKYSKRLGFVQGAFPEAIRLLVSDHVNNGGALKPVTKYQIARILRGPNFKAMLFYASESLARDTVSGMGSITIGELMELYQSLDLAAMISLLVMTRRVRKISGEKLWPKIRPVFARESAVGGFVGIAIPSLGFCPGMLYGALPHLSHALMAAEDPKTYDSYRASLTMGKTVSPERERAIWGCTSAQVGTMLLAHVGFGKELSSAFNEAAECATSLVSLPNETVRKMRLALLWLDCFSTGREQPKERLDTKFFPFKTDRERVNARLSELKSDYVSWFERSAEDISAEKTPKLFAKVVQDGELEIPEQLTEVFTLKEITSMDEWDFDTLVSQLDKELSGKDDGAMLKTDDLKQLEDMD